MVLLFHIMWTMRNLQLLSRPRAVLQGWGLFLLWRWRPRFCAVRGGPIGQNHNNSYQYAYRPGEHRAILFFFFVALRSERSGFRVGRVGHERGIPQSLLGCREFSLKALRLGFPGGGAGTPRGSLLLVFQFRRPAGCRLGRHSQNRLCWLRLWLRRGRRRGCLRWGRLRRWSHIAVSRAHLLLYASDTGVQIGST